MELSPQLTREIRLAKIDERRIELRRQDIQDRARSGKLLAFTKYTKPDYEINWHHRATCEFLNPWLKKEFQFAMVFEPPRHGKSELCSVRAPALVHGLYPQDEIMAASYNANLAAEMTGKLQGVMDTPEYAELFPNSRIVPPGQKHPTAKRNTFEHNLLNAEGEMIRGKYRGQGVGGTFTGKGANWIFIDDPIKGREAADSEAFRLKLRNFYTNDLRTRLEGNGQILLIQTRWHELDLAGFLLELMKSNVDADKFRVLTLPAIKEKEYPDRPYDIRKVGEALWPNKFPVATLKAIRATDERGWHSLQQQNPTSDTGKEFKRAWTENRYTALPELVFKRWHAACISADLRFKDDKKTGDMVVYQAWGRYDSKAYFLGERRGRWGFTESVDEFREMVKDFPLCKAKVIENKANGPALESQLKKEIPGIILKEPSGSKRARLNAVTPFWKAGDIWLPDKSICPEIDAIIEEWVSFGPGCAFDDRTDAMSQALLFLFDDETNVLRNLNKM